MRVRCKKSLAKLNKKAVDFPEELSVQQIRVLFQVEDNLSHISAQARASIPD